MRRAPWRRRVGACLTVLVAASVATGRSPTIRAADQPRRFYVVCHDGELGALVTHLGVTSTLPICDLDGKANRACTLSLPFGCALSTCADRSVTVVRPLGQSVVRRPYGAQRYVVSCRRART